MNSESIQDLHKEGREAWAEGKDMADCPYGYYSEAAASWRRGFANADMGSCAKLEPELPPGYLRANKTVMDLIREEVEKNE